MNSEEAGRYNKESARLNIEDLLTVYRRDLEAANRSPKTISWYMEMLGRFFSFLHFNNPTQSIQDIGREELRTYISNLQGAGRWPNSPHIKADTSCLSPYSIQGHVRAIKAFWGWLFREEYIAQNPLTRLPLPKVPQSLVKTLTIDQFRSLLAAIERHTPPGAKYYCILLFLLDTGVRVSELVSIKMADIDLVNCLAKVVGKGSKERIVPFHRVTRRELQRYIRDFRPKLCPCDSCYLFPTSDGHHISVNSVQQFIRRIAAKAGLRGTKCSPHIFRHTFATTFIAKGGSGFALKEILGHASLQTTFRYTHLQARDLQQQHARFTPLEDLFPRER